MGAPLSVVIFSTGKFTRRGAKSAGAAGAVNKCVAVARCPPVLSIVSCSCTRVTVLSRQVLGIVIVVDVEFAARVPADTSQFAGAPAGPPVAVALRATDWMFTPAGNSHSTGNGCPSAASAGAVPRRFLNVAGGMPCEGGGDGLPPEPPPQAASRPDNRNAIDRVFF